MSRDDELRAMLAYCEAATEGPWERDEQGFRKPDGDRFITAPYHDLDISEEDATFIAQARTDFPAVVKELQAVREVMLEARDNCAHTPTTGHCAHCQADPSTCKIYAFLGADDA